MWLSWLVMFITIEHLYIYIFITWYVNIYVYIYTLHTACKKRCRNAAGEAAHMHKVHGIASNLRYFYDHPTCGACLKHFHNTTETMQDDSSKSQLAMRASSRWWFVLRIEQAMLRMTGCFRPCRVVVHICLPRVLVKPHESIMTGINSWLTVCLALKTWNSLCQGSMSAWNNILSRGHVGEALLPSSRTLLARRTRTWLT